MKQATSQGEMRDQSLVSVIVEGYEEVGFDVYAYGLIGWNLWMDGRRDGWV